MKLLQRAGICLALICLLLFPSCSQESFDAAAYVQSVVDSIYRGEHETYCEYAKIGEDEAEQAYREHLKSESLYFANLVGLTQTDRTLYRTMAFYQRVYDASRYEAVSAQKTEGGFDVEMKISPLNLFTAHGDEVQSRVLAFSQRVQQGEFAGCSQEEIDQAYCDDLLGFLEGKLDDPQWDEPRTVTIRLTEEQGTYFLGEEALLTIDRNLVPYTGEEE